MAIFLVDEDKIQLEPFKVEFEYRGYEVVFIKDADDALRELSTVVPDDVDLVIIDVMLAANIDPKVSKFSREATNDFLETGLRLIERLSICNPKVFPRKAILFSNATDADLVNAIEEVAGKNKILYLDKRKFQSPMEFGNTVDNMIKSINN